MARSDNRYDKTYSRDQIEKILKRAGELQSDDEPVSSEGLTVDELKSIAIEAGLDPIHVEQAVEEIDAPASSDRRNDSKRHQWVTALDASLDADLWREIVEILRSAFGTVGTSSRSNFVREWKGSAGKGERIQVVAIPSEHGTRVRLTLDHSEVSRSFYAPINWLLFPALILLLAPIVQFPIPSLVVGIPAIGALYYIARASFSKWSRARVTEAAKAVEDISRLAARSDAGSTRIQIDDDVTDVVAKTSRERHRNR